MYKRQALKSYIHRKRLNESDDGSCHRYWPTQKVGDKTIEIDLECKPCPNSPNLANKDWIDITENDLNCNGGKEFSINYE